MPLQINAKRVIKIYHGDKQAWSDDTFWEQLTLGLNLQGAVFGRVDTKNKVIQIIGQIHPTANIQAGSVLIAASQNWHFSLTAKPITILHHNIEGIAGSKATILSDSYGNLTFSATETIYPIDQSIGLFFNQGLINKSTTDSLDFTKDYSPATFPITF